MNQINLSSHSKESLYDRINYAATQYELSDKTFKELNTAKSYLP